MWRASSGKERIGERKRCLMPRCERAGLEVVVDHLGNLFGNQVLLRDREANIASIPAINRARISQPHHFFGGLVEHAMAPELRIQRGVQTH